MKDPKTTCVAIIGGLIAVIATVGMVFKTIDMDTYKTILAADGTFCGVLAALFAKDGDNAPAN